MEFDKLPGWGQVVVVVIVAIMNGLAVLGAKKWRTWNGGGAAETPKAVPEESAAQREIAEMARKLQESERFMNENKIRRDFEEAMRATREAQFNEINNRDAELRRHIGEIETRLATLSTEVAVLRAQTPHGTSRTR